MRKVMIVCDGCGEEIRSERYIEYQATSCEGFVILAFRTSFHACSLVCLREFLGKYAQALPAPPKPKEEKTIVCSVCQDTHRMTLEGIVVPYDHCPPPCERCRAVGVVDDPRQLRTLYCVTTPCGCSCHRRESSPSRSG